MNQNQFIVDLRTQNSNFRVKSWNLKYKTQNQYITDLKTQNPKFKFES